MEVKKASKVVDVEYVEFSQDYLNELRANKVKSINVFGVQYNIAPRLMPLEKGQEKRNSVVELSSVNGVIKGGDVAVSDGNVVSAKEFKKQYLINKEK